MVAFNPTHVLTIYPNDRCWWHALLKAFMSSKACVRTRQLPLPQAGQPFAVFGPNQRCLEAILTPLRRRLEEAHLEMEEDSAVEPVLHRALSPTTNPTPTQCFTYCSLTYPEWRVPFYFMVQQTSPTTSDCYCCPTCLPIFDPNFTVSTREL